MLGNFDYKSAENECCFKAGQREANCKISLVDDYKAEGNEVFRIQFVARKEQMFCNSPGNVIDVTVADSYGMQKYDINCITLS
jgi:hypothetical protein